MSDKKERILETRRHFDILDGLRGVAALAVVVFHFMEWVYPEGSLNFIGHGFLAVDFFFCLSGFVIGYAYDHRMQVIGVKEFLISRVIRLHPLVVLGSVLGLIAFFIDPFDTHASGYSTGRIALIFLCSFLLIPFPAMEDRSFNLFGLNAPSWSLFWEYVANIVYAFVLCRVKRPVLLALTAVAGGLLFYVGFKAGNLLGGWSGPTFWDGGARIAYSFSAGLLIYRSDWIIKNRLGFVGVAVLLALAFVMPWFQWNWLAEVLVVLFYFPLMVALGAGAVLSPRLKKVCVLSGRLSYPLYMTHYAVIWIFGHYFTIYKPGTGTLAVIVSVGTVLLVGVAWMAMVWYDTPVRRYLTSKRKVS